MKITEVEEKNTVIGLHYCSIGIWKLKSDNSYVIVGFDNPVMSPDGCWLSCFSITGGNICTGSAWKSVELSRVGPIKIEY